MANTSRAEIRSAIHQRIRRKVKGNGEKPRLAIYRSLNHIYAQVIDDASGKTIAAASTLSPELKDGKGKKSERAKEVGKLLAKKCQAAQIRKVRPPEPYKGKGIKYAEETIRRKQGKTGAT